MSSAQSRRGAGELEGEVLAALWAAGEPLTPGEVQEQLGGGLAYTTVMTTLARLAEKGLAERRRAGRGYAYTAKVDETEHAARQFRALLDRGHDREAILQGFVKELSPAEQRTLLALLGDDQDRDEG